MINNKLLPWVAEAAVYALVGYLAFYLFLRQALGLFPSDMAGHLSIVNPYIFGDYHIPNPAFHILVFLLSRLTALPYYYTGPVISTLFLLVTVFLVHRLLILLTPGSLNRILLLMIAVSLLTVIAIYAPFFNPYYYVGQWSPNIWHSPNMILVKPFVIVSFMYYAILLQNPEAVRFRHYLYIAASLVCVTVTKPNFSITFLPAAALYLLLFQTRNGGLYIKTFSMALPTVMILAYQFLHTFFTDGDASHYYDRIIFTNLGVFKLYTPNVFISMLLVLAFPLSVVIFGGAGALRNIYLRLAWIHAGVAFLQAAFLAEQNTFDQGAFVFGYDIALSILYIFTMQEFLGWFRENSSRAGMLAKGSIAGVFILHLISGIIYLAALLNGSDFK